MTYRLPPLPDAELDAEQREAADEIVAGPRGKVVGPFATLLRSPRLTTHLQRVGAYLRYDSTLPRVVFETVVLLVARTWDQDFEWAHHGPLAQAAGLSTQALDDIAQCRRPRDLDPVTRAAYDLAVELIETQHVGDATYAAAVDALGETLVVELVVTIGYYSTLAMTMNVAQTPVDEDTGVASLPPRRSMSREQPAGRS